MGPKLDIDDVDFESMFKILEKGFKGMEKGFDTLNGSEARKSLDKRLMQTIERIDKNRHRVNQSVNKRFTDFEARHKEILNHDFESDDVGETTLKIIKTVSLSLLGVGLLLISAFIIYLIHNEDELTVQSTPPPPIEQPVQSDELKKL